MATHPDLRDDAGPTNHHRADARMMLARAHRLGRLEPEAAQIAATSAVACAVLALDDTLREVYAAISSLPAAS